MDMWGKGEEFTVGWIRHAEIKHGRVAMMAFTGYCAQARRAHPSPAPSPAHRRTARGDVTRVAACAQALGVHFPWALTTSGTTFADISAAGYPNEQWDALPTAAKLQIFAAIGFLEVIGETGQPHYTKGGQPGYYPSIKKSGRVPHPVPFDLFDPFGLSRNASPEKKAKGLLAEINNGRLAMIGIMGFMCAAKGAIVPALPFIPPYAGEPMAPFADGDAGLPLVKDMLHAFDGGNFAGFS